MVQFEQPYLLIICRDEAWVFSLNTIEPFNAAYACRDDIRLNVVGFLFKSRELHHVLYARIFNVLVLRLCILVAEKFASFSVILEKDDLT